MCGDQVCTDDEVCAGEACSCIAAIHGDLYLRGDGTVIDHSAGANDIEEGATDQTLGGVVEIFDGQAHGCALRDDGTVWCWSQIASGNIRGELGNGVIGGTYVPRHAQPVVLDPAAGGGVLDNVLHISSGSSRCYFSATTCAVRTDGTLWCWGASGSDGGPSEAFFNDGATGNRPHATQILASAGAPLTGIDQVSMGTRHACALQGDEVLCWGANIGGPLGQGDQTSRTFPTAVTLPGPAHRVAAGADVTCAAVDDTAYCWGSNNSGQVGVGEPANNTDGCINYCVLTPSQVLDGDLNPLTGVTDLGGAYLSNCAIRDDDSLWCWGAVYSDTAEALVTASGPATNVGLQTSCGSGLIPSTIRYLTRDDAYHQGALTVPHLCP